MADVGQFRRKPPAIQPRRGPELTPKICAYLSDRDGDAGFRTRLASNSGLVLFAHLQGNFFQPRFDLIFAQQLLVVEVLVNQRVNLVRYHLV